MPEGTIGMGAGCCGSEMAGCVESGPGTDTLVIVVVVTLLGKGKVTQFLIPGSSIRPK